VAAGGGDVRNLQHCTIRFPIQAYKHIGQRKTANHGYKTQSK
jgi:hypothetical protein